MRLGSKKGLNLISNKFLFHPILMFFFSFVFSQWDLWGVIQWTIPISYYFQDKRGQIWQKLSSLIWEILISIFILCPQLLKCSFEQLSYVDGLWSYHAALMKHLSNYFGCYGSHGSGHNNKFPRLHHHCQDQFFKFFKIPLNFF